MRILISLFLFSTALIAHSENLINVESLNAVKIGQGLTRILVENPVLARAQIRKAQLDDLGGEDSGISVKVKKITAADPTDTSLRAQMLRPNVDMLRNIFRLEISVNRYGQVKDYVCPLAISEVSQQTQQRHGWIRCDSDVDSLNFNTVSGGFLEQAELF